MSTVILKMCHIEYVTLNVPCRMSCQRCRVECVMSRVFCRKCDTKRVLSGVSYVMSSCQVCHVECVTLRMCSVKCVVSNASCRRMCCMECVIMSDMFSRQCVCDRVSCRVCAFEHLSCQITCRMCGVGCVL